MDGLTHQTPLTDLLRQRGLFAHDPFVLIDVGCSGGLHPAWRQFGSSLIAHGFDVDIDSCEEVQQVESFPHVYYHAAFVGLSDEHPYRQARLEAMQRLDPLRYWNRLSTAKIWDAIRQEQKLTPNQRRLADPHKRIGVAEFVQEQQLATVDFLKIDIDGDDLDVLESARPILDSHQVLGIGMEINWQGSDNPYEHCFHNTDRLMRSFGFSLYSISIRNYSHAALPAPFEYDGLAQTIFGQPIQGDAIYLRDFAAENPQTILNRYALSKIFKLAALYEMAQAPDCAAELIQHFPNLFAQTGSNEELLNALTPEFCGEKLSYPAYRQKYAQNPQAYFRHQRLAYETKDRSTTIELEAEIARRMPQIREQILREYLQQRGSLQKRIYNRIQQQWQLLKQHVQRWNPMMTKH